MENGAHAIGESKQKLLPPGPKAPLLLKEGPKPKKAHKAGPKPPLPLVESTVIPPKYAPPALETTADKLRFIFQMQQSLPGLLRDAITYQVDLFQLLDD